MISQANNSVIRSAYPSKLNESKDEKQTQTVSSKMQTSKTEELKVSIDSGAYKVDIDALSKKMADSLL